MTTTYRTKTYIAADWTGDKDAIDQLHKWNDGEHWGLSFNDAHDLQQARDDSLNCSIKKSLRSRLNATKTFVLIVGSDTASLKSGGCHLCGSYNSYTKSCARLYSVDYRSYIEYECDCAIADKIKIIVLYNAATVDKSKCPDAVKGCGIHKAMCYYRDGKYYWDYPTVKTALQ